MFIVNVEAAIRKGNKWLIIERSKEEEHAGGLLSLVGGKVEIEDPSLDVLENTLKREVLEEVGVIIHEDMDYVHSALFTTDKGERVVDIVFLCEFKSGEAFPKSPREVEEVFWLTKEEVYGHPKAPDYVKESIKRASGKTKNG